jgi:cytochrome P450
VAELVTELELPEVNVFGMERHEALAGLAAARRQHWLARAPLGYVVTRHEDTSAILRDRRFHSAMSLLPELSGIDDEDFANRQRQTILALEGEAHIRLRRLVSSAFTPRAADRFRPFMRSVIEELVDPVTSAGRCELVAEVCEPYPIPIICEVLGAPRQDWKLFSSWATDIFRIFNDDVANDLPRIKAAASELDQYILDLIERRRAQPGDDLLSDLIAAEEAGDRLNNDELVMLAEAVLMAGTDTTRNQLACSVALLMGHPSEWQQLGARPELAVGAVEESMRMLGAVRATTRVASADIEYRGVVFPAGTLVATAMAAANFDPDAWTDPDEFDLARRDSVGQLTFGSGAHFCLGASLARAELQEALPVLARRMPDAHLAGDVVWKPATQGIWGPARLPLEFRPS